MTTRIDRKQASGGAWLAITVRIGGAPRTMALTSWLSTAFAAAGFALATWYLGATLYLVFHDRLLAALVTRQTEAQYAYEDRIAGLSMQLDRETSQALIDRHTLETTVRDLEERSTRLASHATLIDQLVARQSRKVASGAVPFAAAKERQAAVAAKNPLLPDRSALPKEVRAYAGPEPSRSAAAEPVEAPPLRLDDSAAMSESAPPANDGGGDKRADAVMPQRAAGTGNRTVAALSKAEQGQERTLAALREPALRLVTKLRTALIEAGVTSGTVSTAAQTDGTGGPFVPLATTALTFEQNAALVQNALLQVDRLTELVEKVPLRQPVPGALEVTSTFGPRIDPFLGRAAMHTGIDFREPYGEPVHATAAGTVTIAAVEGGYGTMVEVNHGNGLSTRYAHLSATSVVAGQRIAAGDVVGRVGSSGRATGPHLHYETRINGEAVDPARFLKVGEQLFDD